MTNLTAVNRTIRALKDRLGSEHAAVIELARSLARAVDADPCSECGAGQNAALWKEYRASVGALIEAGAAGDADADDTAAFRASIVTPLRPAVGHTP